LALVCSARDQDVSELNAGVQMLLKNLFFAAFMSKSVISKFIVEKETDLHIYNWRVLV
jgi:hypothetical protein